MLQQAKKSHKQNLKGKKKKKHETADFIGKGLGISLHMSQFSLVVPSSMVRKNIMAYLVFFFFQVANGTAWTNGPMRCKIKMVSSVCLKAF